jgi:flagellar hook protein FlgE
MMRSLWAGVTGLQAHQIAMDVEGNNISNVNTTGFKYSRVNFANLLSQTAKIATAPQGELGGKNPMQIGLGTQVTSITTIYKQGSVQTTDKNTDLAIQGDGFFVVSPDGGQTYKYTRNGDFNFDALGNFTDSNGYIIQGWMRDEETGEIDSTAPIRNITIPPGLTTPANDTTYIALKANLNSGDTIVNKKSIYALDAYQDWYDKNADKARSSTEINDENDPSFQMFNTDKELTDRGIDMGVLFNANGEAFNLREQQGVWVSYATARTQEFTVDSTVSNHDSLNITLNGVDIISSIIDTTGVTDQAKANDIASIINQYTSQTGVEAQVTSNRVTLVNTNTAGTEDNMKNIKLTVNGGNDTSFTNTKVITAYRYAYTNDSVTPNPIYDDAIAREFRTTEDLRYAMQEDAKNFVNYNGDTVDDDGLDNIAGNADDLPWSVVSAGNYNPGAIVTVNSEGQFQLQNVSNLSAFDPAFQNGGDTPDVVEMDTWIQNGSITIPAGTVFNDDVDGDSFVFTNNTGGDITIPLDAASGGPQTIANGASYTFTDGDTLATSWSVPKATAAGTFTASGATGATEPTITVGIDGFVYNRNGGVPDQEMFISISDATNAAANVSAAERFTTAFGALQGALVTGNSVRTTQNIYAANHASSIDVYDSLGSKHTVRFEFTKTGFTADGGTKWGMMISVPEPGEINFTGDGLENIVLGEISFNSDGSLATFTPSSITYTANNGSTPNQNVRLEFGTLGQFDGMTSFDQQSNTSGISQDGYPGGDLAGVRVDETGTLIGSFTNGRSFGLAQVGMAKFTNNSGLESDGGNTFIQTSNSGDPVIGQANIGGRGFIQASSLEMSNVDLSRSLTQLIIVQRGYQANSKTITTSDQMLETLLQLKR